MINYLSSLGTNKRTHNEKLHQCNSKPGTIVRGHSNCARSSLKRKFDKNRKNM